MSKKTVDFKKCMYAGDPEDQFCKNCDGFWPIDDEGEPNPATSCGGYAPEEEQKQPVKKEVVEQPQSPEESEKYDPKAETTTIKAEYGYSCELNGCWHKFTYSEERVVPTNCDLDKEREDLWNTVLDQVDMQFEALTR